MPWTFSSDAVAVDGATGQVVDRLDFRDLSLYSKLSSWGIYLHMGMLFGLPLQIALAATALTIVALTVLGYRMWWTRRPTRGGLPAGLGGVTGHRWPAYLIAGVLAVAVGLFLPLLGASLALFVVADLLISLRRSVAAKRHAEIGSTT